MCIHVSAANFIKGKVVHQARVRSLVWWKMSIVGVCSCLSEYKFNFKADMEEESLNIYIYIFITSGKPPSADEDHVTAGKALETAFVFNKLYIILYLVYVMSFQ